MQEGSEGCGRSLRGLTPEDRELLDHLAQEYGSRTAVLRAGMEALVKRRDNAGALARMMNKTLVR